MRIHAMTATFGKLEHATLSFLPGLNVIEAPNEWGKSTWCTFLLTMLYGLDTRAKSTKNTLADKDHYAPWSGAPMSGRIDLNWNGRDITIERTTKGRTPMGEFRAYETATGLDIPEINSANCGSTLLGVERSVFARAGFLRLTDLPVTQDDALRRRLNALVTTGDESSAGDTLQKSLKDLKNKCRFNRTGLLPQAENQRDQLQGQIDELDSLDQQLHKLTSQQHELETRLSQLDNHRKALLYASSLEDAEKVRQAEISLAKAQQILSGIRESCDGLPSAAIARERVASGQMLQQRLTDLNLEAQSLPDAPVPPEVPARYIGVDALKTATEDTQKAQLLDNSRRKQTPLFWILAGLTLIGGAAALFFDIIYGWIGIGLGFVLMIVGTIVSISVSRRNKALCAESDQLAKKYPGIPREGWISDAADYSTRVAQYKTEAQLHTQKREDLSRRLEALKDEIAVYAPDQSLSQALAQWQQTVASWEAMEEALRDELQAQQHLQTVRSMANTAEPAPYPDNLTYSEAQTDMLIQSGRFELQQLLGKMGQNEGRALALGSEPALRSQLKTVNNRIHQLEDVYAALEIAQDALYKATTELQRRFAPRISKRAQELFGEMTGGRYNRMTISDDLSLSVGAEQEDTLRQAMWRSDGTMDALYLSLRLAVAEELTPQAPLVLDDALVRMDDERLKTVMNILSRMARKKQVILFTCQKREKELL